ncbi:antitoxin Xre/MbcA/ParS toxin-binding domain-containing protein [Pseudomonas sp. GLN_2]
MLNALEEVDAVSPTSMRPSIPSRALPPTFHLIHAHPDDLGQLELLRLVQTGFFFSDVECMVESSSLFKARNLVGRITGRSTRSIHRRSHPFQAYRLDAQQSAVAFQYAKGLELASKVFGSQMLAEQWLCRPCGRLMGFVPFEMLDTSLGFSVVADYLERLRLGVYQ